MVGSIVVRESAKDGGVENHDAIASEVICEPGGTLCIAKYNGNCTDTGGYCPPLKDECTTDRRKIASLS